MADDDKDVKFDSKSTKDEFTAEDRAKLQEVVDKERKARRDADAALKQAQEELDQLKADADSSKSDMDKLRESIADLQERAERAERDALVAQVAQAKKLPAALAGRLTGSTQEELEADADSLIEVLGLDTPEEDTSEVGEGEASTERSGAFARPREKLQPGASNEDDGEPDYGKIADRILSKNTI